MAKRRVKAKKSSVNPLLASKGRKSSSRTISNRSRRVSPERKVDISGVFLIIAGVVAGIGLLTDQPGQLTNGLARAVRTLAGGGAVMLPFILILAGLWIVLRNEQRLPVPSAGRLAGLLLLYGNILAWMHWMIGSGWEQGLQGNGGGILGGLFDVALESMLGPWGTAVVLSAWLLISLALLLDVSIPDLVRGIINRVSGAGKVVSRGTEAAGGLLAKKHPLGKQDNSKEQTQDTPLVYPQGFTPIASEKKSGFFGMTQPRQAGQTQKAALTPTEREGSVVIGKRPGRQVTIWKLPDYNQILRPATPLTARENLDEERSRMIEETLRSFGAPAHVVDVQHGPTFTQYGLEPDYVENRVGRMRVRVAKIASLADDLKLALAAQAIRIQAPVPGQKFVGIEVPNSQMELVTLREGLESKAYQRMKSPLRLVLGKDVAGRPEVMDLGSMPHLLIAGTTGSGKSVCINAMLCSLLLQRTPEELKLVMVDPKRVELTGYNGIPHLLAPVIVQPEKVLGALQWISREMDTRYKKFAEAGVRNIADFNALQAEKIPYIVVVIDELADLMMLAPEQTEAQLNRLAQLARATGIHLVIATQRPSVNVITGMIKANFPARISFKVVAGVDSRVILDQPGAENLIGFGDMLFQAPDAASPRRLQGAYVSDAEIEKLVSFWRDQAQEVRAQNPESANGTEILLPSAQSMEQVPLFESNNGSFDDDPLLEQAKKIIRVEERASVSMLQRKLRIGYTRSARLVDRLEELGIVGKPDPGSGVRPVLDFGDTENEEEAG